MDNTSCHRVQSHAAFLPKAELDGGVGGGGGCYVPWVELVLRSICARKTEVSPGMPPPRSDLSYFGTRRIVTTPEASLEDTDVKRRTPFQPDLVPPSRP